MKKRINYIDIARGITLFFVILGHLVKFGSKPFNWIFSFHMPAFFLLSGMCFDISKYSNFKDFLIKKSKSLLIPYFGFTIFGFIITSIIWKTNLFTIDVLKEVFYYTQPESLRVGQVWFLFALFIASIILYWIHRLFISNIKEKENLSIIIITAILIYIGYSIRMVVNIPQFGRLPFKIDTAFMATSFMLIGSVIYNKKIIEKICTKKYIAIIILLILGCINIFFGTHRNGYVNICTCAYGKIYYYYLSALSGSICILIISYLISKNKILEYYGRNSLFMFAIHSMYLYASQEILTKIYNYRYYIVNNIPVKLCIVTAIAIYILLVPTTMIYNYIKKRIRRV